MGRSRVVPPQSIYDAVIRGFANAEGGRSGMAARLRRDASTLSHWTDPTGTKGYYMNLGDLEDAGGDEGFSREMARYFAGRSGRAIPAPQAKSLISLRLNACSLVYQPLGK